MEKPNEVGVVIKQAYVDAAISEDEAGSYRDQLWCDSYMGNRDRRKAAGGYEIWAKGK